MRRALSGFLATALFIVPLHAQEADSSITGVIQSQIDAFLRDDFATAFTYASPAIKGMFGTPENFGMMVRQGYPMVWRPADVQYLDLEEIGGRLWQKVMITDQSGAVHVLGYQMIETPDGWQINGVQVLQAPQVGA
jgi:hypothetical protein